MRWPSFFGGARLTVAIPLFRPGPWRANVAKNVRRLPARARIVVSDNTGGEPAAREILAALRGDRRVRARLAAGEPGWRAHANDLIAEADTELFAILPQDDRVPPGHYERLVAALDRAPGAGIAFAPILAVNHPRPGRRNRFPGPPFELGRRPPWVEAIELDRRWNLGIPFRGVIRRGVLEAIPATPGDRFADQVWVFGMALAAHLVEARDTIYFKRFHRSNTHVAWTPLEGEERREALEERLCRRFAGRPAILEPALALLRARLETPGATARAR